MQRSISFLWGLVIILLALNLALLCALNLARVTAIETLSKIEATLDNLSNEVVVYEVEVDQAVPIKADVPFNQTIEVPLNTVIPIDQVLTVPFQTPAGEVVLDVPVKTDFPIDIVVPVDFNEMINLDTVVQLNTTLPVQIDIARTPLASYLKQAKLDIARLRNRLELKSSAIVVDETAVVVAPDDETPAHDSQQSAVSVEEVSTTRAPSPEAIIKPDTSDISQAVATDPVLSSADVSATGALPDLGLCDHAYWPLRPGTTWTYNSPDTSYEVSVDNILNNQVHMSTQYEGRDIQFSLACAQEGLGGDYLGDMRRITELGELIFSNPSGMFLPRPERLEEIGRSWTQEFDVTGTVQARQGEAIVEGSVSQGRAVAAYTSTGVDTVETPLGPREALRIEQKLDIELNIDFDLSGQKILAHEDVDLVNVYWFVKGVGPVKIHWQGGTLQQGVELDQTPVNQRSSVPALAEDQLVFVCVLRDGQSSECMRVAGISQSDLTVPPESELEIQGFVLPAGVSSEDSTRGAEIGTIEPTVDGGTPESPEVDEGTPEKPQEEENSGRSALLEYVAAVERLGTQLYEAAEEFWEAALAFRDGQLTLDEFQSEFQEFAPRAREVIQAINRLSPPSEAEAIHQELTSGLAKCDQAIDLMDDWFDVPNPDTKEAATLLVMGCVEDVTAAREALTAMTGED